MVNAWLALSEASVYPEQAGEMSEGQSDNFYHPEADGGISILDESLGINQKIPTEHAKLSEKDTKHEVLKDFESPFEY